VGSDPDTWFAVLTAAALLAVADKRDEAAVLAGGVEHSRLRHVDFWPRSFHEPLDVLFTVVDDPSSAAPLERGSRLGLRDLADAAVEWLERAYPASASISM
jgi:hypothetical protein